MKVVATISGPWPQPIETVLPHDWGYWQFQRKLLRAAHDADIVILRGTSGFTQRYAEAVAALLIKLRWRHPPLVLVSDASWDLTSDALERRLPRAARPLFRRLGRLAVQAPDGPHVVYCVLSKDEQQAFHHRWGIEGERVRFTPFYATVPAALTSEVIGGDYVFAGGNTNRDYPLLVEAARDLDVPVRIASSWQPLKPLPPNVEVGPADKEEYDQLMAGAALVVVPLAVTARSVGQQTYLSAMLLGKPVVVTEATGVRDYLVSGETALVVRSEPGALREAVGYLLDPKNRSEVVAMADRGRLLVEQDYLPDHYFTRLWEVAVEELRRHPRQLQRRRN